MTDITDYCDLLVDAHQTDDLDKIPRRDALQLQLMFLHPEHHDFADLFVIPLDDKTAFERLRAVMATDAEFCASKASALAETMRAHDDACASLCSYLSLRAHCLVKSKAQDALREAYDRLHPEDDGIAKEDARRRTEDWRATA